MRIHGPFSNSHPGARATPASAFTLPELMVSMTVFSLLVSGIVAANLYGLKMFQITETKLNATGYARKAIGKLTDEIRAGKTTWVGYVTNGVFVARTDGEVQTGSGLLIYPTMNTSVFTIYFVDPSDRSFRRTTSTPAVTTVLAPSVTNAVIFRAQDYQGNVLTNNQDNRVIHLTLEFLQPSRWGRMADYYKLETSVTRRALE
jgi:prepilin-type N-terminal cleavage/methylation domain-containing protein